MHDWSLSWQTKGKYWKKKMQTWSKKKKTGKKNWQQEQQTWPSPKLWTYNTGSFLEDAQEQAFLEKSVAFVELFMASKHHPNAVFL